MGHNSRRKQARWSRRGGTREETSPSRGTSFVTSWTLPRFVIFRSPLSSTDTPSQSSTARFTTPSVPPFTVGSLESAAGLLDVTGPLHQGSDLSPTRLAVTAVCSSLDGV